MAIDRETLAMVIDDTLSRTCDDLFRGPSSLHYYPDSTPVRGCGHSLSDHRSIGCTGSWYHSRCASDHDCVCKITREDLIDRLLEELDKELLTA